MRNTGRSAKRRQRRDGNTAYGTAKLPGQPLRSRPSLPLSQPRYRVSPAAASSSASLLSLSPTPSLDAFPSHVFSFRCQASHTGSSDRLEEATKRPSLHFLSCRTLCLLLMLGSGPPSSPASLATEDSSTAGKTDRSFSPSQACAVGPGHTKEPVFPGCRISRHAHLALSTPFMSSLASVPS
ncbi:unnamed protein product [Rangifer tarandus platyrhynchus]|uniref:Uncharacterized protein n=1 Tax=Rangifer tarandus platyrhynchus TaxID=3082113 RepID=A0AC59ZMP1_RANTA